MASHPVPLSQTLSNGIFRSRLLPSLRLCCYGDACSRSSRQLQIVSKWRREKERASERDATRQEEMEEMWKLEGQREDKILKFIFKGNFYGLLGFTWELEVQTTR